MTGSVRLPQTLRWQTLKSLRQTLKSDLLSFLCVLQFCFETRSYDGALAGMKLTMSLDWLWTYRDPPVSGSLRLKDCCFLIFNTEDTIQASPSSLAKAVCLRKKQGSAHRACAGCQQTRSHDPTMPPRVSPTSLALWKDLLKEWNFFGQAITVGTQPSQGLSVNESETRGLNFPQNWIHMGFDTKGKTVFSQTWLEFWKPPSAEKMA